MRACLLVLTILLGCKKPMESAAPLPVVSTETSTEGSTAVVPVADITTPEGLYASCLDRVELPQEAGECEADAACSVAGASGEVCTTTVAAAELVTSAERRRCFAVLDSCGCQEGSCTWRLVDTVPQDAVTIPSKPLTLPPTGGPPPEDP